MERQEFDRAPRPISEVLRNNLKTYSSIFLSRSYELLKDSPPQRLFKESADFFDRVSKGQPALEYLPGFKIHEVLIMLDFLELAPEPNKDIAFMWSGAISHDQKFRWDKPWGDKNHNHKWKTEVYTSPVLREVPIVLAEVKSISQFAGLQTNLIWFTITQQMITFATGSENKDEDWYYHPERVLRKNWINFADNELVMKFLKNKEDEKDDQDNLEGWV